MVDEAEAATFPIVGIGASAGGLEALEALSRRVSGEGMAFIVVQHLAPGHESALTEILARDTPLPVVTAADGMPIEAGHIYVAPPSFDLAVHHGVIRLMPPPRGRPGPQPSIDAFMRSLAADRGPGAIGVVLSGAGTDGTLGLKAIKEEGGITFVQEPSTAKQASMPQSAIDAGYADFCLGSTEIGDELMRLSQHPYIAAARQPKAVDEATRSKLFVLLRSAFGVDFAGYKQTTIARRIQRRMALHRLDRLEDYLKYVQANVGELNALYGDLLIGVTSFFRDKEPFEALKTFVLPRLLENRETGAPIRIWVAGCSTGEEAYSIAICLLEFLDQRAADYKIQIFATDIDDQALARARQAVYPHSIETEISPERLRRFFVRTDRGYQVSRTLRDMVVFARHNLGKDAPFSRIDLVSCRNTLIYMQARLQNKALSVFHYALNPNGYLLLGNSESVGDAPDLFALAERTSKVYAKKNVATPGAFDLTSGPRTAGEEPAPSRQVDRGPAPNALQIADRKVLEHYGPPGVVVNEKFDIVQYRGKTGRFFDPMPGPATTNLLKLLRPELVAAVRPALHRALTENVRTVSGPTRFREDKDDDVPTIRIDVTPLPEADGTGKMLLVLFDLGPARVQDKRDEGPVAIGDAHLEDLERELATTKEHLQATIEELEASNEELQSSNEELQSSNEELQSTNEELETSKEELQSTNEELTTLNEELQNRMAQLNVSNDDLQNLLSATSSVLVLVGLDLRIRRFSRPAEGLFNLIPADVGRPVAYIRTVIKARDIDQTVSDAINRIAVREQKVRCADGHWYTMRITPFRTADHVIRGAVLEFVRASASDKEEEPDDLHGLGGAILATVPQGVALIDEKMCVRWANKAFLDLFHVEADILGRPFEDLWSGKADQPDVWKLLEDAAVEGRPFDRVLITHPFGDPVDRALRFSARRLPKQDLHRPLTLVMAEETGQGS